MNFETHNKLKGHDWSGDGQCPQCKAELIRHIKAQTTEIQAKWDARARGVALNDVDVQFVGTLAEMLWHVGKYQEAWELFETRKQATNWQRHWGPLDPTPVVLPDNLAGKTVLVVSEQGMGDNIMFMRYLYPLKERGARVVFQCRRGLRGVAHRMARRLYMYPRPGSPPGIASYPPFDVLVLKGAEVSADYTVALMSLPYSLGEWEPQATLSYIEPGGSAERSDRWKKWYDEMIPSGHRAIGVMWQGNPQYRADVFRSMQLAMLAPLAMLSGVILVNLNVGLGADAARREPWLLSPPEDLDDNRDHESCFLDTLALMPLLDCVVSVDTSLLHLAGACGKDTYALTTWWPDWRSGLHSDDSPWYESVTHLRQPTPGNWVPVIDDLCVLLDLL